MKTFTLSNLSHKPFVILAYPRTGSYLLVNLLDQFSGLKCYGEVFKKSRIELPEDEISHLNATLESRNAAPLLFLRSLFQMNSQSHTGFKFFPNHDLRVKRWVAHSDEINRVVIQRNPMEIFISQSRADATGVWVDKLGVSKKHRVKLKFEPEKFERMFSNICSNRRFLANLAAQKPKTTVAIDYNEIAAIEPVRKLAEFLGADSQPETLQASLHKQTTEPYSDLFENFDIFHNYIKMRYPEFPIDESKI